MARRDGLLDHVIAAIFLSAARFETRGELLGLLQAVHSALLRLVLLCDVLLDELRDEVAVLAVAVSHSTVPVGFNGR